MKDVSAQNFGYLIAFVLPGVVALAGLSQVSPTVQALLLEPGDAPGRTIGGFLYVTLAAVAAGLTVSTLRWLIVDSVHHATGIPPPRWDDSRLQEKLDAFEALVAAHYRYYQFYSNTLVALLGALVVRLSLSSSVFDVVNILLVLTSGLYWAGSRDTLRRYYRRAEFLLGTRKKEINHDQRPSPQDRSRRPSRKAGRAPGRQRGRRRPEAG